MSSSSNVRPVAPPRQQDVDGGAADRSSNATQINKRQAPAHVSAARASNATIRSDQITHAPVIKLDESPAGRRVHGTHVYDTGTPITLICHLDAPTTATITCRTVTPAGIKGLPKTQGGDVKYMATLTPEIAGDYWYAFAAHDKDGVLLSTREKHFVAQRAKVPNA